MTTRSNGMRQAGRVFHIGVDLAWGTKRPTGLAVLDDSGRLVHVSTVRTDEEIQAALSPYAEGDCLVAIDAPLIVSNETGNRPAEAALNKDFAKFDAGAHPANTGKPEFNGTPRGAALCQALGLDMNPRSGRARRAIEVYPHPATVALFGLGRTLKYKQKPGRDLDLLRAELLALMGFLEGLADADPAARPGRRRPGWSCVARSRRRPARASCASSRTRSTPSCAPTSRCSRRGRPEATTTYGDLETGYIVTPTLPARAHPQPTTAEAGRDPGRPRARVRPRPPGPGRRR